jgi:hypothetical protein
MSGFWEDWALWLLPQPQGATRNFNTMGIFQERRKMNNERTIYKAAAIIAFVTAAGLLGIAYTLDRNVRRLETTVNQLPERLVVALKSTIGLR